MYLKRPLLDPHIRSCFSEAITEEEYFSLLFEVSQNMQIVQYVYSRVRHTLSL